MSSTGKKTLTVTQVETQEALLLAITDLKVVYFSSPVLPSPFGELDARGKIVIHRADRITIIKGDDFNILRAKIEFDNTSILLELKGPNMVIFDSNI